MISLIRALKFSFQDIFRNVWLSIVTVTILALALFSMNALFTVKLISENAVEAVKERINISLYFKPDASEAQIVETKQRVESLAGVKEVIFVSKAEALENFRSKNQNNPEILNALKEIGKNPLSPSLIITPADFDNSEALINSLKALESDALESRDFSDNSVILEKINQITYKLNEVGLILIIIFILIGLLVAYNAIRVAIYTHRQEIEIMRLVGASNFFIYMPYVFSAFFYALAATLIVAVSLFPLLSIVQPYLEVFFTGYTVNIISFYTDNAWSIFGAQFGAVFVVTLIATWLAVRKYARV
ncbi:MAG: cell division protein FtsX [Patescibacteria group bacterium]|jgi:cell division transport system permease protein